MTSQIDFIRYAADQALAVPSLLSLRPYTITLTTVSWTGNRPGLGTKSEVSSIITNANGVNVRFRQVSKDDIVLSGGNLKDQDIVIGPIVFPYNTGFASGGTDPLRFSPAVTAGTPTELYIKVTGPNFPASGVEYKKIYDNSERNVMFRIYLRATAAQNV